MAAMGSLYLVRHGQASFGADDYDQLSEMGQRQSRRLGEDWAERGVGFDAVITGTLKRHTQTWAGIAEGARLGHEPLAWPGLNEYDSEAVIRAIHPHPLEKPRSAAEAPELYRKHFRLLRDGVQLIGGIGELGDPNIMKRLLIAGQMTTTVWRLLQAEGEWADRTRMLLGQLTARPARNGRLMSGSALYAGVGKLFLLLEALGTESTAPVQAPRALEPQDTDARGRGREHGFRRRRHHGRDESGRRAGAAGQERAAADGFFKPLCAGFARDRPGRWRTTGDSTVVRPPRGTTHAVLDTPAGLHGWRFKEVLALADRVIVPLQPSIFDIYATRDFLDRLKEQRRAEKTQIGLVGMRVNARTLAADRLHEFIQGLGVPVIGELRDTQNYVQLAARGLTMFDIAPGRVQRDLEQWQPICQWLD
eukprot:gene34925-46915_t